MCCCGLSFISSSSLSLSPFPFLFFFPLSLLQHIAVQSPSIIVICLHTCFFFFLVLFRRRFLFLFSRRFFFFWTQAILGVASHLIGAPLPLTRLDSTAHLCSLFKEPRKLTLLLKSTTFSSIISSCLYSVFFPFFFKGFLTRCFIECFCFSFSSLTTRFEALCLLCFGSLVHISPFFPFHVGFALHLLWLHPS